MVKIKNTTKGQGKESINIIINKKSTTKRSVAGNLCDNHESTLHNQTIISCDDVSRQESMMIDGSVDHSSQQ